MARMYITYGLDSWIQFVDWVRVLDEFFVVLAGGDMKRTDMEANVCDMWIQFVHFVRGVRTCSKLVF